jgi:DNA-binding response OmpR family regulator
MAILPAVAGMDRVLVVDDDRDTADSTVTVLKCFGFEAEAAYSAAMALAIASACPPRAVLLDLAMPGHTGDQLARELRQLPGMEDAVLICISGYGTNEYRQLALAAGCDYHILKPAEFREVLSLLAQINGVSRRAPTVSYPSTKAAWPSPDRRVTDA